MGYDTRLKLWQGALGALGDAPREVVLATLGAEGPEARVVMLRGWALAEPPVEGEGPGGQPPGAPRDFAGPKTGAGESARAMRAWCFTDAGSAKVGELEADARASILLWDEGRRLQLRLTGRAEVRLGATADEWAALSEGQRRSYGKVPAPGTEIADGLAYEERPAPESFARVELAVTAMDVVHLGEAHRRARFAAPGWDGVWLSP